MNRFILITCVCTALFCSVTMAAQDRLTHSTRSFWSDLTVTAPLKTKAALQFDLRYRRQSEQTLLPEQPGMRDMFANPYQLVFRPWFHFFPSTDHKLRISLSPFGFWGTYLDATSEAGAAGIPSPHRFFVVPEMRSSVQLIYISHLKRLKNHYQLRYEYRVIGNILSGTNDQSGFDVFRSFDIADMHTRQRIRLLYRAEVALRGPSVEAGEPYLVAGEEIEIGLRGSGHFFSADQNRLLIAMGYEATRSLQVELGYLNRLLRDCPGCLSIDHAVQVSIIITAKGERKQFVAPGM